MNTRLSTVIAMSFLATAGARALPAAAAQRATPPAAPAAAPAAAQAGSASDPTAHRAEIYYDFTLGHLYAQDYVDSNKADDASKALDYFKKAYALDPTSQIIGEQLAEMYFLSQRTNDAITEAQAVLRRDPNNLPVRRLLTRIYIRSLGDLHDLAAQQIAVGQAVAQLTEIVRLDPTDIDSALWLARLDRLSNHEDQAEQVLRAVLARDPDNEAAIDQLAQLLQDGDKPDEAVALLEKALASSPSAGLYDRLGDIYAQRHDAAKSEQAFRQAVALDPGQSSHLHGLGQILIEQEKYAEAAAVYEKLVGMEPNEFSNNLRLSEAYRQLHQLDKAEQQVLLAKVHAPGNLEVIYDQAAIYQAEGRFEDAVKVLSDAVAGVKGQAEFTPERRRTLAILYQLLGQLYREEQNYTAAINTLQEMAKLGPEEDQRALPLIIDAYRANRDLPHAFEATRKGLADYPNNRDLSITEAMLFGENNQPDQAAQVLHSLLTNSAADVEIDIDLGEIYTQDRRYADAEQAIRSAEKLSQQPSDRETTGFLLGDIYAHQKKFDQAEQSFKSVLELNPNNAAVLNYYGYMLADRGVRLQEAVDMVQKALKTDPNNAAFLDSLGWAYYKQDRLPEAEIYLRKAATRESHDPTMLTHLGDVLAKAGHPDQAEAQWERALAEWHRALPAELEDSRVTELEQKISNAKQRLAQQKTPGDAGSQ